MLRRLLILSLFGLAWATSAHSQNYLFNFQKFGIKDGLSHRNVQDIMQDRDGFIWIATPLGLNRFDGYGFKSWTKDENGLTTDNLRCLFQDPDGLIWLMGSDLGDTMTVDILDPKLGTVVSFKDKFAHQFQSVPQFTLGFGQDPEGNIYLGTRRPGGVIKYHPKTGFQQFPFFEKGAFFVMFATGQGTLWGIHKENDFDNAIPTQLVEMDMQGRILRRIGHTGVMRGNQKSFSKDGKFCYETEDRKKRLYDPANPPIVPQGDQYNPLLSIRAYPLWTFLEGGLLMVNDSSIVETATGKVLFDLKVPMPEINRTPIHSWTVDRTGHLWLGYDFGLVRMDIQPALFKTVLFNGDNQSLGKSIRGIKVLPDGSVFVNCETEGQYRLYDEGRKVTELAHSTGYYFGVGSDPKGNIYYSKSGKELERLSPNGEKKLYQSIPSKAWCFYQEGQDKMLLGTKGEGIYVLDEHTEQLEPWKRYNGFDEFGKMQVIFLDKAKDGTIWACTENGLYQLDLQKGVLARYWTGGKGQYYLPSSCFLHFHQDAQGIFWLATNGSGLLRWDKASGQFQHFGRKAGFSNGTIYAVYEDNHEHLWIPSDFGIIQFDKKRGEVRRIYGINEGISHQEFNRVAHARAPDGTLYFGGLNGITIFNPEDFYGNGQSQNAPLVIDACEKIDGSTGKSINITSEALNTNSITLEAGDRYFAINLALLTYEGTAYIQYAYKFDDENEWHTQSDRSLRLGGQPYGQRKLRIKAQAANGLWAANELELTIVQLKPYYFQAWFILLSICLLALGIFGVVRWRTWQFQERQKLLEKEINQATAHIGKQAEELRRMDEVKSRFFANVSHELRTPLTLILGPLNSVMNRDKMSKEDASLLRMVKENGKSLLNMVNQILDLSKLDNDKLVINLDSVPVHSLLGRIVSAFESHAASLGIQLRYNGQIDDRLLMKLDAQKLETILNNLLSNAIKFTPHGGEVKVTSELKNDTLLVTVQDNGRGIHPDDLPYVFDRFYQSRQPGAPVEGGTGIGLALCKELANLMGGNIRVESPVLGSTHGSAFILALGADEAFLVKSEECRVNSDVGIVNSETFLVEDEKETLTLHSSLFTLHSQFSILIVEDNPNLREYLKIITEPKFKVATAENGQAALDYLASAEALPDLILSDVMMPVMDGFQFLEKLKSDARYRHLPVIMLTALADLRDKLKALRIGVDDYLVKPFAEEELIVRMENLLRNSMARKETQAENLPEEPAKETRPMASEEEMAWLEQFEKLVKQKLGNTNLTADELADQLALSRASFFRQVKKLTGLTPGQYIEEARFQHARYLLESGKGRSVKAAAYAAGFLQVEHFSRQFQKRFGKYPSEYLQ